MNRIRLPTLLVGLVTLDAANAQTFDPNMTVTQYIAAKISESHEALAESFLAEASDAVGSANTGFTAGATDFKSSTLDFVSLLSLAAIAESKRAEDGDLVIDFNLIRRPDSEARHVKLQGILNAEPEPFEPMLQAIPEDQRDAQKAILASDLTESDNYTVSFSYNLYNERLGRDFALHRDRFAQLIDTAFAEEADLARRAIGGSMQEVFAAFPNTKLDNFQNLTLGSLNVNDRLISMLDQIAADAIALDDSYQSALTSYHLDQFSDLIDNQPQLHVSLESSSRSGAAGPDRQALVLTYEKGFVNLNDLRRRAGSDCTAWSSMTCLSAFRDYVEAHDSALRSKDRLAFSLKYVSIDPFAFTVPAEGGLSAPIEFMTPSSSKLTIGMHYGRQLAAYGNGDGWRLDTGLEYEDPDDESRNTRAVATMTLTRKMGDLSVPIGIVYANKPEFLTGVDEELTAQIGFNYDIGALLQGAGL